MTFEELKFVLSQINVDTTSLRSNGPQLVIPCPLAKWFHAKGTDSNPSLSIKYGDTTSWTVFKCFACKEGGKLWQLVDSYGHLSKNEEIQKLALTLINSDKPTLSAKLKSMSHEIDDWYSPETKRKVSLNPDCLDSFDHFRDSKRCCLYLNRRNVPLHIADKFNLLYDPRQERIVFPVKDRKRNLVGAVGRAVGDKQPRYFNYFGFSAGESLGGVCRLSSSNTVLLVEGFFDLLHCYEWCKELDVDVVCSWRSEITSMQASLLGDMDKTIQVWYDQDMAGTKGFTIVKKLLGGSVYGLKKAAWDSTEDVGEMSKRQFFSIFNSLKGEV